MRYRTRVVRQPRHPDMAGMASQTMPPLPYRHAIPILESASCGRRTGEVSKGVSVWLSFERLQKALDVGYPQPGEGHEPVVYPPKGLPLALHPGTDVAP